MRKFNSLLKMIIDDIHSLKSIWDAESNSNPNAARESIWVHAHVIKKGKVIKLRHAAVVAFLHNVADPILGAHMFSLYFFVVLLNVIKII